MLPHNLKAGVFLLLGLAAAACQDLPTAQHPQDDRAALNRGGIAAPPPGAVSPSKGGYPCLISKRTPNGPHQYHYMRVRGIQLPQSVEARGGRKTLLQLTFQSPGEPVFARVNCRIPATQAAVDVMLGIFVRQAPEAALSPAKAPAAPRRADMSPFVDPKRRQRLPTGTNDVVPSGPLMDTGCVTADSCTLSGVTAYGYPAPSYPDPWGYLCSWGCGWNASAADYGGGDYYDPGTPPDDGDVPCATGDAVLDSQPVQQGMASLWSKSNPDALMAQRLEKGGWVMWGGSDFYVQPFPDTWTLGPCGIDAPAGTVPPEGAIAWIHTHPYSNGELLTSCEADIITIGGVSFTAYTKYGNDPSSPDGDTATKWNLPGIVVDKNKITEFTGNPNSINKYDLGTRYDRCGY